MRQIQLSKGLVAVVDDEDFEALSVWKWYAHSGGYAVRNIPTNAPSRLGVIYMHRQLLSAPEGLEVDHINGNKRDNRRCNLRLCTTAQNQHNRKKTGGTSRFKGVRWEKARNKWRVQIVVSMKTIFIGRFTDEESAARAYDTAALQYYGQFARTNFTPDGY